MEPLAVGLIIVALAAGFAVGWLLGCRPVAEWKARHAERDGEAREHEASFKCAIAELGQAQIELATLKANAENFDKQVAQLKEAKDDLLAQFKATGGEVLSKAQEEFLKRAEEKFGTSEKASKEAVAALLEPVNQRLKSYEEQVASLEKQRIDAFGELRGLIGRMHESQEAVRNEAARLGNSLRSAPKASGRWGELHVENVLEKCGLAPHTDYVAEASMETGDGRLRPDFIVSMPGNKKLIIDAKNIWADYDRAYATDSPDERERHLKAHVQAVKTHIVALSSKTYHSHVEGSAEYVALFIPGEHLLYAALERDDQLWNFAFDKNVILATPTNLVAIAKSVARVWQHVNLEKDAREIAELGKLMYDSLAKTQTDLVNLGKHLGKAVDSFNDFSRTYDGHLLSRGRRLADKHVRLGKHIVSDEVPLVESAPRYTTADTDERPMPRLVDTSDGAEPEAAA